jgi:hypothetical protein
MERMPDDGAKPRRRLNWGVFIGYLLGGASLLTCIIIACVIELWWLNVAILVFGLAVGWNVGFLLSPKNEEKPEFAAYAKGIATFLGGFLIAKLDILFAGPRLQALFSSAESVTRFLLFGITFFAGVQFTWVGRRYGIWIEKALPRE